ncbi:TonB-dependent receptor [Chitinophaga defluvii]|uniref:TonB-dependent receptor n=1 Tax=Chitinophaga defluvii TaxID=3163343 RepID=A0ABV2T086_9BACT
MRCSLFFTCFICASFTIVLASEADGQRITTEKISITAYNQDLKQIFHMIASASGAQFVYSSSQVNGEKDITLVERDATLEDVLNRLLLPRHFKWKASGNHIIITQNIAGTSGNEMDAPVRIRGRVFDQADPPAPLPGVSVAVKGTSRGTATESDGSFEIKASPGEVLVFSFMGYKQVEYVVGKQDNITISLQQNVSALEQVVVTGYSSQKVKNLASSLATVNPANIQAKPITQLSQALQGGVTGLTVQQGSGLPGGDAATIKIRGINTLGYTSPLILVDGVPFDINNVDPTTVENITILKDAAAASIYGARAANGVILVTTRRGVPGKVQVTYDGYVGMQNPTYVPKFVDAARYMEIVNEANSNVGRDKQYTDEAIATTRNGSDPLHYPNTDWTNIMLKKSALITNHTLGVSGGNSVARFAVTATYLKQDGIMDNTSFDRFMLRANTSVTLRKNIIMFLDLNTTRGNQTLPYADGRGNMDWMLYMTYGIPPNVMAKYPVREDGLVTYGQFGEMRNPLAHLEVGGVQKNMTDNVQVNFQPKWEIVPGLNLKMQYNFRIRSTTTTTSRDAFNFLNYFDSNLMYVFGANSGTSSDRSTYNYLSGTLDYERNIDKHRIFLLGGASQEFDSPDAVNISTLRSVFAKLYYSYNDKYLLEAALRGDGSSRFGPGNKWGSFPSVALGWNISNEHFLKGMKALDNWKLRASYGMLGNNQNVGNYQYQTTINTGNGVENTFGNPDITWEKVKMLDIGTDLGFFNNNLHLTIDWYDKTTDDILLAPPVAAASGLKAISLNAGKVRNRGWEFALDVNRKIGKQATIFTRTGFSAYKNTILSLWGGPYYPTNAIHREGDPLGMYYGFKTNGLLQQKDLDAGVPVFSGQQPGDIKYVDYDGNGVLNDDDRTIIGNPEPRVNYFINLGGSFKGFDLEVQLNGYGAHTAVYRGRIAAPLDVADPGAKPMEFQTNYWTPTNTNARFPRIVPNSLTSSNVTRFSDFWFENAAYARIRFIQLGYNFNTNLLQRFRLSGFRIYANAQNPFTFTKMGFLDPESKGGETTYPLMRVYTFGVSARF